MGASLSGSRHAHGVTTPTRALLSRPLSSPSRCETGVTLLKPRCSPRGCPHAAALASLVPFSMRLDVSLSGLHCSHRGLRRAAAPLPPLLFDVNERGPLEAPLLPWGPTRALLPRPPPHTLVDESGRGFWGPTTCGCLVPMLTGVGVAVLGHPCSRMPFAGPNVRARRGWTLSSPTVTSGR